MRKLIALSLVVLLVFGMAPMAFAQQSGEVVKIDTAPTIDGTIDAVWADANVYQMTNFTVAEKDNAELDPVKSADDFSAQWRALWDEDNFYVLVEVTDDVLTEVNLIRDGGSQSRDDSVRILLGQEGNNHVIALFHAVSEDMYLLEVGPDDWIKVDFDTVDYAVTQTSDGYLVEAAIPWEIAGVEPITPAAGGAYKLDIQAIDNDFLENTKNEIGVDGRYPQSRLTWSYDQDALTAQTINPYTADLGNITLVDPSSEPEEDSSSSEAPATGGEPTPPPATGGDSGSSTPDMPRTGLGGTTDSSSAAWILVAVFIVAVVGARFMKLRRN